MPDVSLKERLAMNTVLVAPAAFDMVSAKVIEKAGFEAVYLSGFGQSASHLGLPDAYGKGDQCTPAGRW
jgi:2-methylisocitrate lyase-like PEP mutase family enzyme